MTDGKQADDAASIVSALPRGTAVIYRNYTLVNRRAIAVRLRALCRARGLLFIVAEDINLAKTLKADGLHLPSRALKKSAWLRDFRTLSAACHTSHEVTMARAHGIDIIFLSPLFETNSHPGEPYLGPDRFREIAMMAGIPVLALGGVTLQNFKLASGANIVGFAAIGAFGS